MKTLRDISGQFSTEAKTLAIFSSAVVLWSIEALFIFMALVNTIPLKSALAKTVFPEWLHLLRPERDMLFFRFFVVAAIILQSAGLALFRRKFKEESFFR